MSLAPTEWPADVELLETAAATSQAVRLAAFLYVDPQAPTDGDGSLQAPFRTLAAGLAAVDPGQTLIVAGGTYRERIDLRSPAPGTALQPITVRAAAGERPVVQGLLWLRDLEHWVIDGINVTWDPEVSANHMVKFTNGADWEFRNSEVWGARAHSAILVYGNPVNFRLSGLHVHDTVPTNGKNQDHLIYLNSGTGGGVVEQNVLVGSPNGKAIKIGQGSPGNMPISNIDIRYNTMVDNLGPSNIQLVWGVSNVTVERNIMVSALEHRANVTSFELYGTSNIVRNNIGWRSEGVVEPARGLVDGGSNQSIDPVLSANYVPTNPIAVEYGHLASERP